jgi:hypothetical protein
MRVGGVRVESTYEGGNGCQDLLINLLLRLGNPSKLTLRHEQRMVAAFDAVKKVGCFHLAPDAFEQIQGAERIARSLHEQDWRPQIAQNFIAQPFRIARAAERIAEANQTRYGFFQSNMATDPAAHALSDQDHGLRFLLLYLAQRLPVRGD